MSRCNMVYSIPPRYLVLLSFLGYILLAFYFPLLPNYDRQPVGDIRTFAPGLGAGLLYGLLILALFALYWLLFKQLKSHSSVSLKYVCGIGVFLALPLLFMYPINANDVYRYIIRGLISSRYRLSPFEYAPADFGEELYPLLAGEWYDTTTPYGPLWEWISALVTWVGKDNFLANIIMFKIIGLLALVTAAFVIWRLFALLPGEDADNNGLRAAYTALWALNPALLLTIVGNAHNDGLMILILLLGWLVIQSGYHGPGFLLMLAAALVKPIALLAVPVAFVLSWKMLADGRSRIGYALWVLVGGIALLVAAFLPFGSPGPLFLRLLREASAGASFSPLTLLILILRELDITISFALLARLATVVFAGFYLWILWRTWRGRSAERGNALAFWGYTYQALNFRIWYATWPFPWFLLDGYSQDWRATRGLYAGLWFLLTAQLSVIFYGHIRVALLNGSQLWAHLLAVPFVFLLPPIAAWFSTRNLAAGALQGSHLPPA